MVRFSVGCQVKSHKVILIALMLFLVACQPQVTVIPISPTLVSPTPLPTTATPTATTTSLPPKRVPTFTPPPPNPTLSQQEIAVTILTELSIDETHAYSPNGMCEWKRLLANPITESARDKYNGQFFTYVTVSCGNQEKPWVLVNKWALAQEGYSIPDLLGWSAEEKSAYYYDSIIPDGCQPLGGFQQNLRQVDLGNGNLHTFPLAWTGGISLSPDTAKVVYYDQNTSEIGIYDLNSGAEQHFPFDVPASSNGWFAGNFTWSPDGKDVLFLIQYGDACFPTGDSVQKVDLQGNKINTVLEQNNKIISISGWSEPGVVTISMDGKSWNLDPFTGSISAP